MEGTADDLFLLFARELVEVYGITRYTDSEVGIEVGIFHSIDKFLSIKHVYVYMMCVLSKISAKNAYKIFFSFLIVLTKSRGDD